MECKISIHLAYLMLIYILASIFYLFSTLNMDTPLKNSLTDEQKELKRQSADRRRNIFYKGVILSIFLLYLWRPFKNCNPKSIPI